MPATSTRASTVHRRQAIYDDAVAVLAADYGPEVTIDTVAQAVATSRRQLQRAFTDIGATTFSAHLVALRMRRAAVLLAGTPATIAEVSEAVGYREPSQFRKAFKQRYGLTPGGLRRRARDHAAATPAIRGAGSWAA